MWSQRGTCDTEHTIPTQNIHNCSISLKKIVSCLVRATAPHKGNAAASIFISCPLPPVKIFICRRNIQLTSFAKCAWQPTIIIAVKITGLINSNSNIFDKSEFLQEAQLLHLSEGLKLTLDSPTGIVQRPVSSFMLQNADDTSSKLALLCDVSRLPDIHENVRSMSVKRRPSQCGATVVVTSSPYENKSAGCMEKKAPKEQKKKRQ